MYVLSIFDIVVSAKSKTPYMSFVGSVPNVGVGLGSRG